MCVFHDLCHQAFVENTIIDKSMLLCHILRVVIKYQPNVVNIMLHIYYYRSRAMQ